MKKMIITIIILAIIFIGMVINRQIEQANEIKIEEIQLVENYMEKMKLQIKHCQNLII